MGCQNSKLNRDILAIPPKLRPLLWRKVEELRRRRSAATANGGTLSKKELLTDGVREESDAFSRDHESLHENYERNDTTSSPGHESVSSSASQPKTIITEEDKKKTSEEEIVEPEKTEINMESENQERSGKDDKEEKEEEEAKEEKEDDLTEDEGDQEAKICPSSPSFRVYFIESLDQEEEEKKDDDEPDHEDKDDSKENENDMQKEWNRENSVESVVLIDTHEDQETKIVKKKSGKSRMRFRRALCRGGPVAVKHLLNVRSCYHPSSDRASLLAKKSAP